MNKVSTLSSATNYNESPDTRKVVLPQRLILMGPQGSGKGTQAKLLQDTYGYHHFEMGGILTQVRKEDTEIGRHVDERMSKGDMADKQVVMAIVENYIDSRDSAARLMFDGMPRTSEQMSDFTRLLESKDMHKGARAVLLDLPREEAVKNIVYRGIVTERSDDQDPNVVNNRLNGFYTKTMPVAQEYERRGQLIRVDAMPEVDMVYAAEVESRIKHIQIMVKAGGSVEKRLRQLRQKDPQALNGHAQELQELMQLQELLCNANIANVSEMDDLLGQKREIDAQLKKSIGVVFDRLIDGLKKT